MELNNSIEFEFSQFHQAELTRLYHNLQQSITFRDQLVNQNILLNKQLLQPVLTKDKNVNQRNMEIVFGMLDNQIQISIFEQGIANYNIRILELTSTTLS